MSRARRLAIATRGFRGGVGDFVYVTESIALDEPEVGVTIEESLRVDTVEILSVDTVIQVVGVDVSSLDQIPGDQGAIDVLIEPQTVVINLEDSIL